MKIIDKNSLDKEVQSRINFFEDEYKCTLMLCEDEGMYFMFTDDKPTELVELSSVSDNKYKLMKSIRNHFRPNARF